MNGAIKISSIHLDFRGRQHSGQRAYLKRLLYNSHITVQQTETEQEKVVQLETLGFFFLCTSA